MKLTLESNTAWKQRNDPTIMETKNHLLLFLDDFNQRRTSQYIYFTWRALCTASAKAEFVSFPPELFDF